jgi:hypothetical protein
MTAYDEQRLAELIKALPPAPQAWVEAAQVLPLARGRLDDIVAKAEADLAFRDALVANLEEALRLEGYEPETIPLDELRRRLESEAGRKRKGRLERRPVPGRSRRVAATRRNQFFFRHDSGRPLALNRPVRLGRTGTRS